MTIRRRFLILACGGACLAAPQAVADTRDDVIAAVQRCGVIHDNRVWLDCVYGAQQPMRAELGLSPVPEFQQRLVPPAQIGAAIAPPRAAAARPPAPRKKVGFFGNLLGNAPPEAVSRMSSFRYDKNGAFIVSLENGQQWHQTDVADGSAPWIKEPSTYMVTINQGAFGSYLLRTNDSPRSFKVELVK